MSFSPTRSISLTALAIATTACLARDIPKLDLRGHRGPVTAISVRPDGKQLASISVEEAIWIWDLQTGRHVQSLEPRGKVIGPQTAGFQLARRLEAIDFAPDGTLLVSAADESPGNGVVRLWDVDQAGILRVLAENVRNLRAATFSPDGKLVAINLRDARRPDHRIALIETATGETLHEFRADRLAATHLTFSPDGDTLVSAGGTRLHVWDVPSRSLRHTIGTHAKPIQDVAFSSDNKTFASADTDERIRIWDAQTGKRVRSIKHKQQGVYSLAFSPSGRTIASGGKDGTIRLFKVSNGRRRDTIWAHTDAVTDLEFGPDGDWIASCSRDNTVALWTFSEPTAEEDATADEDKGKTHDEDEDDEDNDDD
jgi:WD40 repeat protein